MNRIPSPLRSLTLVFALAAAGAAQARTHVVPHVLESKGSLSSVATACPSSAPVRDAASGQASGKRQHGPACAVSPGDLDGDGRSDRVLPPASSKGHTKSGHVTLLK